MVTGATILLHILLVALLFGVATIARAQTAGEEPELPMIERALEEADEADADALIEELEEYRRAPLPLDSIAPEDLARLPGISLPHARSILDFVRYNHPTSIGELRDVQGITPEQIATLRAFTRLTRPSATGARTTARLRAMHDLRLRRGYTDTLRRRQILLDEMGDSTGIDTVAIGAPYLGSPLALLTTVDVESPDLMIHLAMEKDPGEPLFARDTAGITGGAMELVDPRIAREATNRLGGFASGGIELRAERLRLLLGDYTADVGQGLALGSGGGFKGSDPARGAERHPRGLRLLRSANEISFLRGAALEGSLPLAPRRELRAMAFLSIRSLDATLGLAPDGNGGLIDGVTTIRTDGLRRTRSELARSGNLTERLAGARCEIRLPTLRAGITGWALEYSLPLLPDLPYELAGRHARLVALDLAWDAGALRTYGELALGTGRALGGIAGLSVTMERAELSIAVRSIAAGFHSPHAYGFGESPMAQRNETGIYAGIELHPDRSLTLDAYCDLYRIPQRTSRTPLPRSGADARVDIAWRPLRRLELRASIGRRSADALLSGEDELLRPTRELLPRDRATVRLETEYATRGEGIRLRGSITRTMVAIPSSGRRFGGVSTSLELRCGVIPKLTAGVRGTLFAVDGADAAITQVDAALPGRLGRASLDGGGRRLSLILRWRPVEQVSVSFTLNETFHTDRTSISDGLEEIPGPESGNIGLQIDVRL